MNSLKQQQQQPRNRVYYTNLDAFSDEDSL